MAPRPLSIEQILDMLPAAPQRIAAAAEGIAPDLLRMAPEEGSWSANEVLAHLRACADVWGGCIARILDEDQPTIRAVDPRTWMRDTDYPDLAFYPSLRAYTEQRAELLAILTPLSPEQWERSATMTGAGKPIQRTVQGFAWRIVVHERPHLKQIERAIAAVTA